ncbi:MAG: extracellular solute-binding protein [Clostridia bacterium]|nr:extracellular solute-binding protein [Clostridia bacterium]
MKKWLCMLLATLMLLATAACGKSDTAADGTTLSTTAAQATENDTTTAADTALEDPAPTDGLPNKNMDGFSLNIVHHDTSWLTWAETQLDAKEVNGELVNDAIYERNTIIEDRFNATINVTSIEKVEDMIQKEVMSGDNTYDIYMQYGIRVLSNLHLLADFNNIPKLSLDADYWNPAATGIFCIGNKQIAIAGNFSLSYASGSSCMVFNKDIYSELKIADDPYALVREGKWTTDKFFEIAAKGTADLNGDGTMDTADRFGSQGSVKSFFNGLINGADIQYVRIGEDGAPYFTLTADDRAVNFMQKLLDKVTADPYVFYNDQADVDSESANVKFTDGKCLFNTTSIHKINTKLRGSDILYGILPQPKYDEQQEKYYSQTNIGEIATLPRSFDDARAENIGILLEAMAFYSQQHIIPQYKEVILQAKAARDEQSMEMLGYVFDGICFDFGVVVWQNEVGNILMEIVFKPKANNLGSTIRIVDKMTKNKIGNLMDQLDDVP